MERLDNLFNKVKLSQISTGFKSLDKILNGGFSKGLYVIGAMPAIGKTSLALQITSNIAEAGKDVLFFSLLQPAEELFAKILSRFTYENNKDFALNAKEILYNKLDDNEFKKIEQKINREEALKKIKNIKNKIKIFTNEISINDISEEIEKHIKTTGNIPFVIIDYIQVIAPFDYEITDKQIMDLNIMGLKNISAHFNLTVLGLSSINRASYEKDISMESFKESGPIENIVDVLIGLQCSTERKVIKDTARGQVLESDLEYKARIEKQVHNDGFIPLELKILKNRYGITGKFDIFFKPPYSYFTEDENETIKLGTVISTPKKRGRKSPK